MVGFTQKVFVPLSLFICSSSAFAESTYKVDESFEDGGWNAEQPMGFTPGLKKDIANGVQISNGVIKYAQENGTGVSLQ